MSVLHRLALSLALAAALPCTVWAQTGEVKIPPPPPMPSADLSSGATPMEPPQETVTPAAEVTLQTLVRADDDKMSCDALRGEIRSLVALVQQKEVEAEQLQRASVDKSIGERLAAANQARAADQAKRDEERLASRVRIEQPDVKYDPNAPAKPPTPDTSGIESLAQEFKGSQSTITPSQMRQWRLTYIAYEKGC